MKNPSAHDLPTLESEYRRLRDLSARLDLSRGRPDADQLELSNALDGILGGEYRDGRGDDLRNYARDSRGIDEMRALFGELLQMPADSVIAYGNSSLQLIYHCMLLGWLKGLAGQPPWNRQKSVRFLCPVPGYDRHFRICESLGIEMTPIAMDERGPDMDEVEKEINDAAVKGMFCVPRFSNPSGVVYADETVARIAALGREAAPDFRIFWDNAYACHAFDERAPALAPIGDACEKSATENSCWQFCSTSKISFGGGGVAGVASGADNIAQLAAHLADTSIGPDRINQLRHSKLFPDLESLRAHMRRHAELVKPKFEMVKQTFETHFGASDADNPHGRWSDPQGGYFVLFNAPEGRAKEIVRLAGDAGLRLTAAGCTWPGGVDPRDSDIRIAPTTLDESHLKIALDIFVCCVKLVAARDSG